VAQSGAVGGVVLAWAREYGLGISKFASYGNGADLNEIDFLRYLAGDEETRVVGLYIETVADGREFMRAVEECAARKPVVVIKAGRTQSGQRATLSHTGSLAGSDAVYDAALRQCGALRVQTIEEMFDVCQGFLYVGKPSRTPHDVGGLQNVGGLRMRVAIVTNSGGPGVLAADRAEEVGLEVAEPSPAVKARLAEFLPAHCALKNPIDLTVEGTEEGYRRTLLAVLEEYDAALALNIATPYLDSVPLARGICDAARESGKPVVAAFLPGRIVAEAIPYLQEHGVPNFATGERAVAALARRAEYEVRRAKEVLRVACCVLRVPSFTVHHPPFAIGGALLEPEAMAWLRENGLPVPDFRCAPTVEEAVQGCREIGYPAVMKVVSPDILHKSDCGGVVLGIRDDEGARAAFQVIRQAAAGKDFRGVVICPLIEKGVEVLLGLSRDPQFGPVVAFGLGGIYTEVWRDVALRVAPIDWAEAESMVRQVKSFPLLAGVRGQPPRDLGALAEALVRLSWLPFRYPEVGEVDLNPVFLFEKGRGLVVGDARVMRNAECGMRSTEHGAGRTRICRIDGLRSTKHGIRNTEHETLNRGSTAMTTCVKPQRGVAALRPYVPGTPIEEVQREYGLQDVIKLASNENPLGPSPRAMAAIAQALPGMNMYPDGESYALRQALAGHLGVRMEQVAVGNGADGIILQTCMAYLDEDCEVVVSRSSFPVYDIFTHVMRAGLVKVPLKGYGLDLEGMGRAITERTRLVMVCNPNNPTGTIVTATEVGAFLERVPEDVLVVFDEAYFEFVASEEYPDTLRYVREGRGNVMVMRTFSKIYGVAGLRLGYAVAAPEILEPLQRVKEPFAVNLLAQVAGVAALEDVEFVRKSVEANHAGRLSLYREFERLGLRYVESHTNFILVEIGPQAVAIQRRLLEKGVIVRPCTGYDLPDWLRITVGSPAQNGRLIEALGEVL